MSVKGLKDLKEDDFGPREPSAPRPERAQTESWPSREPRMPDGALSIKGPASIINRFKAKTGNGRSVKYYEMLDLMMNFCDRHGFNAKLEAMSPEEREDTLRNASTYK